MKLVVPEAESSALRRFVSDEPLVSCALARVELVRAVHRHGASAVAGARELLERLDLLELDDELLEAAAIADERLRSLDAIHFAAARRLGPRLQALATYDDDLAEAAAAVGIRIVSPGRDEAD